MKNSKLLLTGIFLFTCQLAIADKIDRATPELYLHCSNGKILDADQVKKGQKCPKIDASKKPKQGNEKWIAIENFTLTPAKRWD